MLLRRAAPSLEAVEAGRDIRQLLHGLGQGERVRLAGQCQEDDGVVERRQDLDVGPGVRGADDHAGIVQGLEPDLPTGGAVGDRLRSEPGLELVGDPQIEKGVERVTRSGVGDLSQPSPG